MAERTCEICGSQYVPHHPGKQSRFCGNACRFAWMRAEGAKKTLMSCDQCGAIFKRCYSEQVSCSKECADSKKRAGRLTIVCGHCEEPFTVPPSSVKENRQFCSWECRTASGAHHFYMGGVAIVYKYCSNCGRLFVQRAKKANRYEQAFCSMGCRNQRYGDGSRRTVEKIEVVCRRDGCERTFTVYPSQLSGGRGKFCSKACNALAGTPGTTSKISIASIDRWATSDGCIWVQEYILGPYAIDLAIPMERIAVELDGEFWHSLDYVKANDLRKNAYLAKAGWELVRVPMLKRDTPEIVAEKMIKGIKRVRRDRKWEAREARRKRA